MKKVLILGASGFIGFHLFQELRKIKSWQILGTSNSTPVYTLAGLSTLFPLMDLSFLSLIGFLKKNKPDIIINCIALSSVDACELDHLQCSTINLAPTRVLAEYCSSFPQVKYIFFSSSQVFDGKKNNPYTENDPPSPINHYGSCKYEAEKIIYTHLKNFVIIRPSFVYGIPLPWQHGNLFHHIYKALLLGKEFVAYTDMLRNPCFLGDLAPLVEAIIKHDERGIFHAGGEVMSVYDFALEVARIFELNKEKIILKEARGNEVHYKPLHNALSTLRTREQLEISFTPVHTALQKLKENLFLQRESRGVL